MAEGYDGLSVESPSEASEPGQQALSRSLPPTIEVRRPHLAPARPSDILRLQRTAGNRAVARALAGSGTRILLREPPPRAADAPKVTLTPIAGSPFPADPSPDDVHQGQEGDCNLLAPLAAVARAKPAAIRRLITSNSDGTYNVTLFYKNHSWNDRTPHTIQVTSQFYTDADGNPIYAKQGAGGALWVMLIEKAFAKWKGGFDAAYGAMTDGEGLELITGSDATVSSVSDGSEDDLLKAIRDALATGAAVTVNTSPRRYQGWLENDEDRTRMDTYKIVKNHAYSIKAVDITAKTLDLHNPWGFQHITGLPVSVFRKYPFLKWARVAIDPPG
jgi:hypothetical protein